MLDLRIVTPAPVRVTGGLGVVEADLRVNGPGEAPVLGGRITVREGRFSLPARKLDGVRGRIDFDPAHPGDPALDLQARCRVPGHGISLAVQNRFSTREVRIQTDPPLSPQETIRKLMPSVTRVSGMDRTAPVPEPWIGSVAPADPMRALEFRYTWRVR
jgi:autotransporter translocation and assembly factor TamB